MERLLRGRVLRFLRRAGRASTTPRPTPTTRTARSWSATAWSPRSGRRRRCWPQAGPGAEVDRPPAAPADAGLHRHPHPHAAGAGDRLLGGAAARLAEHLHLPGGGEVRRPRARRSASPGAFLDELLRHGTTTAVAYCSSHPASVDAYFAAAEAREPADDRRQGDDGPQLRRRACATRAQSSYDDSKALIDRWHGRGRALYAITPRFAITSTPAQMEMAQALVAEHPDLHMQTHLSENRDEIDFTLSLYPKARDYLDVYETLRPARAEEPVRPRHPPLRARDARRWRPPARWRSSARPRTSSSAAGLFDDVGPGRDGRAAGHRHRRRRRHQLLDAAHARRGLQGAGAARAEARPARAPSGGSPAATPRRCRSRTGSARWRRGRRPTSSCSTARPPRRWRCAWRRSDAGGGALRAPDPRATTARWPRPTSPATGGPRA